MIYCLNKELNCPRLFSSNVLSVFVVVVVAAVSVNMYKGLLPNGLCSHGVVCWVRLYGSQYCSAVS